MGKPSAARVAASWRAPHSAIASTERWLARIAVTAKARIAGKGYTTLAARRGSGTCAKAAATLVGETDSGPATGVDCIMGSFALGARVRHVHPRKAALLPHPTLAHKPFRDLSPGAEESWRRRRNQQFLPN